MKALGKVPYAVTSELPIIQLFSEMFLLRLFACDIILFIRFYKDRFLASHNYEPLLGRGDNLQLFISPFLKYEE